MTDRADARKRETTRTASTFDFRALWFGVTVDYSIEKEGFAVPTL
jgi:hypothetical protein